MPGKVKVKILSGRNLPVMDRGSDTTDAYVEIKFGSVTHKTDVCRKSLNPQWNSDWYRFEVDDAELQDEPLQIRLMDHDTYSANDAIGKVNISLNPLLLPTVETNVPILHSAKGTVMSGWIPVFDTMHGIRGEVNLIVKVDLFSDANKFRQSSCGIQFFHSPNIPHGYAAQIIHGFVEELVVNDDPEYQWIDKIRTPRASNEARQVVFLRLSGQVQRKIGLKAIDLGANAVIGYTQCFDLEGDVGVVARGIGTAVTLVKIPDNPFSNSLVENTVAEERTLKYFDFLANNNSNNPNNNSNDNSDSQSVVQDMFGIDTNLYKSYYCDDSNTDRKDEDEESVKKPQNIMRKLSSFGQKMLGIPNKISDAIRDRSPNPKRKSADDDEGLRMGALLVASIMSTDIGDEHKNKSPKVIEQKRKGILKNSSSSESTSTTKSDPNILHKTDSIIINADNLRSLLRQMIEEQKGTDDQQQNWILPEENPNKSKSSSFIKLFDDESSSSNDDSSSTSLSSSSASFDDDAIQSNKNLCLLQALLNDAKDDDGYEIWIKPEIKLTAIDDADEVENGTKDTIIEPKKEIVIKKLSNISFSSQPSTSRNSPRQSLDCSGATTKRSNSVQFAPPSLLKSNSFSLPYNLSKLNKILLSYNSNISNSSAINPNTHCNNNNNSNNNINNNSSNNDNAMLLHAHSIDNFIRNEMSASPNKQQQQQQPHSAPILPQHHVRTESIGGRVSTAKNIILTASSNQKQPELAGSAGGNAMAGGGIGISTAMFRRSSDSDLSVTPKGNSLTSGERVGGIMRTGANIPHIKQPMNQENLDMLEYPFLTISKYPSEFILHLGATVAARSVKLLERVPNPDEPETRDSWWTELRMEIRSHARALGCNVVIGYSEVTSISDEVCVLSATGTAAVINFQYTGDHSIASLMTSSLDRGEFEYDTKNVKTDSKNDIDNNDNQPPVSIPVPPVVTQPIEKTLPENVLNSSFTGKQKMLNCTICHIPYSQSSVPFHVSMKKCNICKKGKVPDVILATIEMPDGLQVTGRGCLVQAQVCRPKRDLRSELNAKEISDGLPFLEYELHRLLINKLKVKGMNAIFGLKATVAIGERMIALMATGTGVYLASLPPAIAPKIVAGNSWSDMDKLGDLQKALVDTYDRNRDIYQLKYNLLAEPELNGKYITSDTDDSDEDLTEVDLNTGNKDTCILEVDDIEDVEIIASLMERCPPEGFYVVNTQFVPGLIDLEPVRNLQMFTQVWRAKFPINQCNINFAKHFQRILQSIYYKLRRMTPCAICDLKYRLDFPETDEIQLLITGMALGLGEPRAVRKQRKMAMQAASKADEELIFNLDEEELSDYSSKLHLSTNFTSSTHPTHTQSLKIRSKSPTQNRLNFARIARHMPVKERYGVDITPLSYIPGGTIEKYLGNLNFFFIRESTSVRENGGISGFVHSFITEILAIVRSHVLALNGNAMVAFYMTELILVDNPHKNQGQCIISVGGDVVHVSYKNDD